MENADQQANEIAQRCRVKLACYLAGQHFDLDSEDEKYIDNVILQETGLVELVSNARKAEIEMLRLKLVEHVLDGDALPPDAELCPTIQSALKLRAELAEVRQCLLNREESLKREGKAWAKAMTERDAARDELATAQVEAAELRKDKARMDLIEELGASIRINPESYIYRIKGTFRTAIDQAMKETK